MIAIENMTVISFDIIQAELLFTPGNHTFRSYADIRYQPEIKLLSASTFEHSLIIINLVLTLDLALTTVIILNKSPCYFFIDHLPK